MSEANSSETLHSDNTKILPDYNSTREPLFLPEYGRMVQSMVEYAMTIQERTQRQAYVEMIVRVMIGLNEKMKDVPDFVHKIWDHVAYISNYRLDVDYPFAINKNIGERKAPLSLSYPQKNIRFRHYGYMIQKAFDRMNKMDEGEERERYVRIVATRMKRNLADWKGDGVEDEKVARDISLYTEGKVVPDFSLPGKRLPVLGDNRFRSRRNKGLV